MVLLFLPAGTGRAATPVATTVVSNPSFATLAVDGSGTSWGRSVSSPAQMYRSRDEGATWTRVTGWDTIGRRPWYMTPLAGGVLLAAYDTGFHWAIARSADGGTTWSTVLSLPCIQPDCSVRYTTLGSDSIAQGDGFVFLGTYSNAPPAVNTNFIYRSADNGVTWSVANTSNQFRHIHGLEFDPVKKRLYVLFGDSVGMATWYSADDGVTLTPLCTAYACTAVEATIDPTGTSLVAGTDNPGQANQIFKLDTATGARSVLAAISYTSYSSNRVGGTLLVAETHEPGAIPDPQIHVYGSNDGGATWGVLFAATITSTQSPMEMYVDSVFPNGDFAVQVEGRGTVVLRLSGGTGGGGSPPANSSSPVVSGSPVQGQALTATAGGWSGNPTSFAYQWRRCSTAGSSCSDIAGAVGGTYLVQAADVGSTLRVRVTASNGAGASAPADSSATATCTAPAGGGSVSIGALTGGASSATPGAGYKFGTAYTLASAGTLTQFQFFAAGGASAQSFTPAIYGSSGSGPGSLLAVGATMSVAAGQAAGWVTSALPSTSLAAGTYYLVLVSGPASNAASIFYTPGTPSDGVFNPNPAGAPTSTFGSAGTEARRWSFRAVGAGGGGGGGPSVPVNSSLPTVSGVAQQGQVLGASPGVWSGAPASFAYQWRRCSATGSACSDIVSATAVTYVVQAADVGFALRVRVTASNSAGPSAPADSNATAPCVAASSGSVSFGAAAPGTSSAAPGAGYKFGTAYTLASAGTVTRFQFFAAGGASAQSFTPAIYSAAGSAPGSLLAVGGTVTVAAGQAAGWVSATLPTTALAAGTYYLVLVSGSASNAASISYDPGNATDGVFNPNPAGAPTSTFGAAGTEARRWSFRVS